MDLIDEVMVDLLMNFIIERFPNLVGLIRLMRLVVMIPKCIVMVITSFLFILVMFVVVVGRVGTH